MMVEIPILDREGKKIKILLPTHITLDSASKFEGSQINELRDKNRLR